MIIYVLGQSATHAQLVDVNFSPGPAASGAAVIGGAGDIWNHFTTFTNASVVLTNVTGTGTSVTITYSNATRFYSDTAFAQPNTNLMDGYMLNGTNGSLYVTLTGLQPNMQYVLYVYLASNDMNTNTRAATVTANGVSTSATGMRETNWVAGGNYVLLTPTADSSGTIAIIESNPSNASREVDFNGFQIEPGVSEPVSATPLFDVNFSPGPAAAGAGVIGGAGDIWNHFTTFTNASVVLTNVSGAGTSVTITYSNATRFYSDMAFAQPNTNLMDGYMLNGTNGSLYVTLTGLQPNMQYVLYVYLASNDMNTNTRAATVTANGVSTSATGMREASWVAGNNYVLLTPTADSSGTIAIIESNPGNASREVDFNGFQIGTEISVPVSATPLFDVNFSPGLAAAGAGVIGGAGDIWNHFTTFTNASVTLTNVSGVGTSATITYSNATRFYSDMAFAQPNTNLMDGYMLNGTNGSLYVTLTGLQPNTQYVLYVYLASNDINDDTRAATVTANGVSTSATGMRETSWVAGGNYVLLTPAADSSGTMTIIESNPGNSSREVDFNGFQIGLLSPSISVAAAGQQMTLSWPSYALGWILQSNSVGLQAANQWFPYPGSTSTTNITFTIPTNSTNQAVFFRLAE